MSLLCIYLFFRTRSLTILFDVVKQYGHSYETNWWQDLFSVLFRIFDVVKLDQKHHNALANNHSSNPSSPMRQASSASASASASASPSPSPSPSASSHKSPQHQEWIDTTCNHTLYAMTDVFNEFFGKLSGILLDDLLSQYEWCVHQANDQLSRSAVSCLENLVLTNKPAMDLAMRHRILSFLSALVLSTICSKEDLVGRSRSKIQVHLEVLSAVHRILFDDRSKAEKGSLFDPNSFEQLLNLVDCLKKSHDESRRNIAALKASPNVQVLNLLFKQETDTIKCALDILLELYQSPRASGVQKPLAEAKLLDLLHSGLSYFLTISSKTEQENWCDLLAVVFEQVLAFPEAEFRMAMAALYDRVCDMLLAQTSKKLRVVLCDALKRAGRMYGITSAAEGVVANSSQEEGENSL